MCGLSGILTTDPAERAALAEPCVSMRDTLTHRGPDDCGLWVDPIDGVALGFRRLSIVDLSREGHQPMESASRRFVLVFNGEVYNSRELGAELAAAGARFRGHSDTEVILAAFERWGIEAAVQRFIGMFVIAVWDRHTRTLSLIRDRLGIKPLYVYWEPGLLLFGSELKALIAHPRFTARINRVALASYLRYLYVPAPASILHGVSKLLPGSILKVRDASTAPPAPQRFWSAEVVAHNNAPDRGRVAEQELVEQLHTLVADAVSLRMRAA